MKNRRSVPAIAAVVAVVAIAAITLLLRGYGREEQQVAVEAEPSRMEAPAQPAVAPARSPTASPGVRGGTANPVIQAQLEERLEQRGRMREEHRERTRAFREQLAGRYQSESVDPAWASGKMEQLAAIAAWPDFERANAKPSSIAIDCRSSICRIDAEFADHAQAENWITMFTAGAGGAISNSVVSRNRNEDGSMRVELIGRAR